MHPRSALLLLTGLFLPAALQAQDARTVEPELLWSHDTGG